MYSFSEELSQSIRDKANNLLGKIFKYKQLCIALGIEPVKNSNTNTKNKQIRDLQTLIELREIPQGKQKAYLIVSVHEHSKSAYYDRDEWYSAFKSVIFSEVHMEQWFTRTTLFYKLGIVNDNYKVVLHDRKRRLLSKYHGRSFYNEYRVCRIAGGVMSDKVYNALDRMERDGLIRHNKGYVIQYKYLDNKNKDYEYSYREVRPVKADELYQWIESLDKSVIDEIRGEKPFGRSATVKEVTDEQIKNRHYEQFIEMRNIALEIKKTSAELYELLEWDTDKISIEGIFDVHFIRQMWYFDDVVIRPDARRILNDWAKKTILNTKDKRFNNFSELKKGCVDVYIDLATKVNYAADVKCQKEIEREQKEKERKKSC